MAVSTAAGSSPRAIVRLSGPDAVRLLAGLAGTQAFPAVPQANYIAVHMCLEFSGIRRQADVYLMRAPTSYTREDIVELHIFGNPALQHALLNALTEAGARPAQAGEFTRRAFLNGRLDLAQAEAVQSLIHARSMSEYRAACSLLSGRLSQIVNETRGRLLNLLASIEVALDFSDQDVEIISQDTVLEQLKPILDTLNSLLQGAKRGRIQSAEARIVFFGPPNAGKSSLFNALLQKNKAIVSPHPGTTRDTVEGTVEFNGLELVLVDTAGLRGAKDEVEGLAVLRSHSSIQGADMALCVLDGSIPPHAEALEAIRAAEPDRTLVLLNKSDLGSPHPGWRQVVSPLSTMTVSARVSADAQRILERIRERVEHGRVDRAPDKAMVNARQEFLLRAASQAMSRALAAQNKKLSLDLIAGDIREAIESLSALTGASVTTDVLDKIFSNFCIGK